MKNKFKKFEAFLKKNQAETLWTKRIDSGHNGKYQMVSNMLVNGDLIILHTHHEVKGNQSVMTDYNIFVPVGQDLTYFNS